MKKMIIAMIIGAALMAANVTFAKNGKTVIDLGFTTNQISMSDLNASNKKDVYSTFPDFPSANAFDLYTGYLVTPKFSIGSFFTYIAPSAVEFTVDSGAATYDKYSEQVDATIIGLSGQYIHSSGKLEIIPNLGIGLLMVNMGMNIEMSRSGAVYKITNEQYVNYTGSVLAIDAGVKVKYSFTKHFGIFANVGYLSGAVNQSDMTADKTYTDSTGAVSVSSGEKLDSTGTVDLSGLKIGGGLSIRF